MNLKVGVFKSGPKGVKKRPQNGSLFGFIFDHFLSLSLHSQGNILNMGIPKMTLFPDPENHHFLAYFLEPCYTRLMVLKREFRVDLKKWSKWSKMGVWKKSFRAENVGVGVQNWSHLHTYWFATHQNRKKPVFGPPKMAKITLRCRGQNCIFGGQKWRFLAKMAILAKKPSWGICSGRSKKVKSDHKKGIQKWSKMAFSGFSTWFHFHDLSMGFRVEIDTRGVKWVKKRGPKRVKNGIFKGWFFRSFFQFWKIQAWIAPGFPKTPKNEKKTTQKVSTPSKNRSKMGQKRVIFDPK